MTKVAVVGTGYVGLVSGVGLASVGHQVTCVDLDPDKVSSIERGVAPIHERGLNDLLRRTIGKSLRATTDLAAAVQAADITMICVGTPFDGRAIDLSQVRAATEHIGAALDGRTDRHTVVVKSTVVPGTTDSVVKPILEQSSGRTVGADLGLGMNPEFLREGVAVDDFLQPDRIVLGGIDDRSVDHMAELYAPFTDADIVRTDSRTAEMTKYANNALLATLISFSNEIANLAAAVGVDAADVMEGVKLDRRLSPTTTTGDRVRPGILSYLDAGCGFGGSCFGKDVRALIALGHGVEHPMRMLGATIAINEAQPSEMIDLLRARLDPRGSNVTVLGLAFKPDTDDVRDSPALPLAQQLVDGGAVVTVFDPKAMDEARRVLGDSVTYAASLGQAIATADAILLVTAWAEFAEVPAMIAGRHPSPPVIDGRRILDPADVPDYLGIGRPR